MILTSSNKHVLLPEKDFAGFVPPPQTIPNSPGHYVEWIEECKGGRPSLANFDYAGWDDRSESPRKRRPTARGKNSNGMPRACRRPMPLRPTGSFAGEYRKGWEGILPKLG